jgi:hypothetical protein
MAKRDYVPNRDGDLLPWSANLKTKVATHGPAIDMSATEITDVQTACDTITARINAKAAARTTYENAISAAEAAIQVAIKMIRNRIGKAKKDDGYTNEIGEDMGVVGPEQTVDVPNSRPDLTSQKTPQGYELGFNLKDYFHGVNIYKKLPAAPGFTKLSFDSASPYLDNATIENGTQYYAFYVLNDVEVGQQSDILTISV